jgi:hypothetical protein
MSWSDLYDFIDKYQALIAGLIAIIAAYITARPVWRQLEGVRVQTNTLFRDYVLEQLRRTANRKAWYSKRLGSFNDDVGRRIHEMDGEAINVHWAHDTQQRAAYLLEEMEAHAETRDLSAIEEELTDIYAALNQLIETLDCIHRPYSMEQHDADHSFTDEEWAELKVAAGKAEESLSKVTGTLAQASKALDEAFVGELSTFRQQLRQVQVELKNVKL